MDYLTRAPEELCADCQERLEKNPLRVLDCKNPAVPGGRRRRRPPCRCALCEPCRAHFEDVQRQLAVLGIPFVVNPRMVRGLDYYTRTAFEFIAAHPALGTASTVGGGGRYDKLVKELGGPDVPAVGFALGMDRLCCSCRRRAARRSAGTAGPLRGRRRTKARRTRRSRWSAGCGARGSRGLRHARRQPQEPDEARGQLGRDVRAGAGLARSSGRARPSSSHWLAASRSSVRLDALEAALLARR